MNKLGIFLLSLTLSVAMAESPETTVFYAGKYYKDAQVQSVRGNTATIRTRTNEVAQVPISVLPPALKQKATSLAARQSTTPTAAAPEGATGIAGRVLQKLKDGLLIYVSDPQTRQYPKTPYTFFDGATETPIQYEKAHQANQDATILLKDHPREASLVDDDWIRVIGFEHGTFAYTDTSGATRTVRVYSVQRPK